MRPTFTDFASSTRQHTQLTQMHLDPLGPIYRPWLSLNADEVSRLETENYLPLHNSYIYAATFFRSALQALWSYRDPSKLVQSFDEASEDLAQARTGQDAARAYLLMVQKSISSIQALEKQSILHRDQDVDELSRCMRQHVENEFRLLEQVASGACRAMDHSQSYPKQCVRH